MTAKDNEPIEYPNTFAGRRAEREAEGRPANVKYEPRSTFRAGTDAPQPVVSITRADG